MVKPALAVVCLPIVNDESGNFLWIGINMSVKSVVMLKDDIQATELAWSATYLPW